MHIIYMDYKYLDELGMINPLLYNELIYELYLHMKYLHNNLLVNDNIFL
jgi:hypothetical protein